jgi:uncharacterized protein (DUF1778 family)
MNKNKRDGAISAQKAATALCKPTATWTLNEQDFNAFVQALLNPHEPNPCMKSAIQRSSARRAEQQLETYEAISRFEHRIG